MHWRTFWATAILLLACGSRAHAAPPNVILVLVDDAGYGDLSCHGNPVLKTPNIDRLHGQACRCTDFHVAPMCTPTRGQLLTGVDCLRNGAMNVSSGRTMLRAEFPTLANLLRSAGYRTGQFGKWHLGDNYPYRPQDRGFQVSLWFPSSHIPSAPDYWHNSYFDTWLRHEDGHSRRAQGYCTDVYFDAAMHWIAEGKASGEPFFVYLPLNAAHSPLQVPDKYRQAYAGQTEPVARFFGMLANIDENMGRLDTFLTEQNLSDNTIVIYMTDNGGTIGVPVFNAGMRGRKMELYDGGHRVPFLIRWPAGGLTGGRDVGELTTVQDVLPTLAELCGLKLPADLHLDGLSLAGLLRGTQAALPERMVVVQYSRIGAPSPKKGDAAVLHGHWRLVGDRELYDITADPGQALDVAADQKELVQKMREHYGRWWSEIEPTVNQLGAITLGSDAENPTMLSPADWADVFLDQSAQVREGVHVNGPWNVQVDRGGDYEVSLRRWPVESDLALDVTDPARVLREDVNPGLTHGPLSLVPSKALPIARARLKVGDIDQSVDVKPADPSAEFRLSLPAGRTQLQTWFYDAAGKELCGAYYVYVRRK